MLRLIDSSTRTAFSLGPFSLSVMISIEIRNLNGHGSDPALKTNT